MITWWLLLSPCLLSATSEPLNFDPFFGDETSFFAPQDDSPFGAYSDFSFSPSGGVPIAPDFQVPFTSETSNIPIYTDGVATPPQITLSHFEKDYKSQLHHLANSRTNLRARHYIPKFKSEPFPLASDVDERKQSSSNQRPLQEPRISVPKSKPVELQTGFVPIIKGSTHDQRKSKSFTSSVIKDIEPPILTAAPGSLTSRPTLLKVSASVQSSSKVPANIERQNESSPTYNNEVRAKARQASFSRFLNYKNDSRNSLSFPSSTSESVVSRVVTRPESILDLQQKDLLRVGRPRAAATVSEESKTDARRTLEINCDSSSDLGWCELDDKYPKKYVNQVISSCPDVVDRMHVEVPHSFEKLSDTSDFKAEFYNSTSQRSAKERGSHDAWSWAAYFHQGSLCDAETGFLRPETAKDSTGTWNIIVQTDAIKQRVPIEMCRKTNSSCKKMLNCGLKSQCLQKYNYHLLLSLNPTLKHDCPFMKLYRFPSACVCHVE